jgi:hypothetical protein
VVRLREINITDEILRKLIIANENNSIYPSFFDRSNWWEKALTEAVENNNYQDYFAAEEDAEKPAEPLLAFLWKNYPDGFYVIHRMRNFTLPLGVLVPGNGTFGDWKRYTSGGDTHQQLVDLGVAVHETIHEYNNTYFFKMLDKDLKGCIYNVYCYYLNTKQTIPVVPNWELAFSAAELKNVIPARLRTFRYKSYIYPGDVESGVNPSTNTAAYLDNGIYFFLDEFVAYYHSCRYHYICTPDSIDLTVGFAEAYAEFKFFILTALIYAKNKHPEFYEDIFKNTPFRTVFTLVDDRFSKLVLKVYQRSGYMTDDFNLLMNEMKKPAYQAVLAALRTGEPADLPEAEDTLMPEETPGITFGGKDDDQGQHIQRTKDGVYIFCGAGMSSSAGKFDMYIGKITGGGNLEWEKSFGGKQDEKAHAVVETADVGYIVCGTTTSFGAGGEDVYIIRTDGKGNIVDK